MGSKPKNPPKTNHRRVISTTEEMRLFLEEIVAQMTELGFEEKDIFSVRLGLEEAIVNAIRHGNRFDPNKKVELRYTVAEECVVFEIEDEGDGFNPDELPDPLDPENLERPSGRGVYLMHCYMSSVEYNEKGNCVKLYKERSR